MFAQELRHAVVVERQQNTPDGYGGEKPTWVPFIASWRVSIKAYGGKEFLQSHANKAEQLVRICGRYRTGITAEMRLRRGSTIYVIEGPPNNIGGTNRYLECMCSQGKSDA